MKEIPTSRLQGWDYIKSLMDKCPVCGENANLGKDAVSSKYMVCCMNFCCEHMTVFYNDNWGKAITEWNKYVRRMKVNGK